MFIDLHHLLYVFLPCLALSLIATIWVKASFARWSKVENQQGITGAEAARVILKSAGIQDVQVEEVDGFLSDHYDPRQNVLRLSSENYQGRSIAAVGVAAHEAGHAIQHATGYAPLAIRNLAVPMASIGSSLGYFVLMIGIFVMGAKLNPVTIVGLGLIAAVALFQLINLPVEFDASARAVKLLPSIGILSQEENVGVRKMLRAAAFTYVAATVAAVAELAYWFLRLSGNSRSS